MAGWAGIGLSLFSLSGRGEGAAGRASFQPMKMRETAMIASKISKAVSFTSIPRYVISNL
jgi:hypothetical protein